MSTELIEKYLPAVIAGILGFGGWIWERRNKNAELQKVEADAIIGMQAAYRTFVDDSNIQYAELKKDIRSVQDQLLSVQGEVIRLQKEVVIWKGKYDDLKSEMESAGVNKTSNGSSI